MDNDQSLEVELVSRAEGKRLAEAWIAEPKELNIPDTLLSSGDIETVVKATGLISPFFTGGGKTSRRKKAAYEGRIGSKVYMYGEKTSPEKIYDSSVNKSLVIPKNSIVFVESDLDFRIPDFIALRFNLQIQHVHRGLLLGTGPLVDPGFWGKLCIPLHNLTDQDYEIPSDVGLIWIEFTKTTLGSEATDTARSPLETLPSGEKGHWEIEKFLDKAAGQFCGNKIPIKSSLPTMFKDANAAAIRSATDAKSALSTAEGLRSLNTIALVAAGVALCAICITASAFLFNLSGRNEDLASKLMANTEIAQHAINEHISDVDRYGSKSIEASASVPALRGNLARESQLVDDLKRQVKSLSAKVDQMQKDRCVNH